jgi:hypothetical protein
LIGTSWRSAAFNPDGLTKFEYINAQLFGQTASPTIT